MNRPPAKPKLKEGEAAKDKPNIPLWKRPDLAMETPLILPDHITLPELKERLQKMKLYRLWAQSLGLAKQVVSETELKLWLVRSRFDHKLSELVIPSVN